MVTFPRSNTVKFNSQYILHFFLKNTILYILAVVFLSVNFHSFYFQSNQRVYNC